MTSAPNILKEKEIQEGVLVLKAKVEKVSRQKSREAWLKDADVNTRFFYMATIVRKKRSYIGRLVDD